MSFKLSLVVIARVWRRIWTWNWSSRNFRNKVKVMQKLTWSHWNSFLFVVSTSEAFTNWPTWNSWIDQFYIKIDWIRFSLFHNCFFTTWNLIDNSWKFMQLFSHFHLNSIISRTSKRLIGIEIENCKRKSISNFREILRHIMRCHSP